MAVFGVRKSPLSNINILTLESLINTAVAPWYLDTRFKCVIRGDSIVLEHCPNNITITHMTYDQSADAPLT